MNYNVWVFRVAYRKWCSITKKPFPNLYKSKWDLIWCCINLSFYSQLDYPTKSYLISCDITSATIIYRVSKCLLFLRFILILRAKIWKILVCSNCPYFGIGRSDLMFKTMVNKFVFVVHNVIHAGATLRHLAAWLQIVLVLGTKKRDI